MGREQKGGKKGVGEGKGGNFFPLLRPALSHPVSSTSLLSLHFSRGPNVANSFERPEFRSLRTGTLATQASWLDIGQVLFLRVYGPRRSRGP